MSSQYGDASHVDVLPFYARRPCIGKVYRLLGYLGLVGAAMVQLPCVGLLMIALIFAWLAAWWQVVGTLWRSSLVAGILLCAVRLTLARACGCEP